MGARSRGAADRPCWYLNGRRGGPDIHAALGAGRPRGCRDPGLPVLDWSAVLSFQAARRNLPDFLVWPTEQVIRFRIGFDITGYNQVRDARSLRAPTLLFQDGQETFVPPDRAASLAKARPDLVEYHFFPEAGHTEEWNVDQGAYESILTSFLVRKLSIVAA
jgi:pimeloyl-ACP methyl ester carboxylesterase